MPAIVKEPLKLYAGVPFAGSITLRSGLSPMDLTGLEVTANLHSGTPDSPGAVVYTISTTNDLLAVASPATGVITFALTGEAIATYDAGDYVMPVFVTDSGG